MTGAVGPYQGLGKVLAPVAQAPHGPARSSCRDASSGGPVEHESRPRTRHPFRASPSGWCGAALLGDERPGWTRRRPSASRSCTGNAPGCPGETSFASARQPFAGCAAISSKIQRTAVTTYLATGIGQELTSGRRYERTTIRAQVMWVPVVAGARQVRSHAGRTPRGQSGGDRRRKDPGIGVTDAGVQLVTGGSLGAPVRDYFSSLGGNGS